MSAVLPRSLIVLLAVLTCGTAACALEPLQQGGLLTGRLRLVQTRHPNGTPIRAYQIVSVPRDYSDEFCDEPPKTFHLVVTPQNGDLKRLKRSLGKTVTVRADSFFCSETAWHIGDAVVFQWQFATPR